MTCPKPTCKRCHEPRRIIARGLCGRCYSNPTIRELFPPISKGGRSKLSKAAHKKTKRKEQDGDAVEQGKLPSEPTIFPPGHPLKIKVMEERVRRGEMPFHEADGRW